MQTRFVAPQFPRVRWPTDDSVKRNAVLSSEAPRVPWDKFVRDVLKWNPGEHVALIGPTGQGKTTLLLNLLPLHPYVAIFATKPKDSSMERLINAGYMRVPYWSRLNPLDVPKRVLWPDATRLDSVETQRKVFRDAFQKIYIEGGWTVAIDELWFIINVLNLREEIKLYLLQGRALGISLVSATQRPAFVPLEVYDQSTHLFFWRDNDRRNLERLSDINARSAVVIRQIISNLEKFQVLYINTRTGIMVRTRAPVPTD